MEKSRIRVISIFLVWILVCACFVGMLSAVENVEASANEKRITWNSYSQEYPAIHGDKIVW